MKKLLGIIVLGLMLGGNAYADLNGYGEIKLNQFNVNEFEHYLSDGIHDKNAGHLSFIKNKSHTDSSI